MQRLRRSVDSLVMAWKASMAHPAGPDAASAVASAIISVPSSSAICDYPRTSLGHGRATLHILARAHPGSFERLQLPCGLHICTLAHLNAAARMRASSDQGSLAALAVSAATPRGAAKNEIYRVQDTLHICIGRTIFQLAVGCRTPSPSSVCRSFKKTGGTVFLDLSTSGEW